jgi:hypothetical protein
LQTSSRPRELGGSFSSRRAHGAQLSISDTNHHVTEAIGDMYGDDDYGIHDSRPLSFVNSPLSESVDFGNTAHFEPTNSSTRSRPMASPNGYAAKKSHTAPPVLPSQRNNHFDHAQLSPALSLRDGNHGNSDTANKQFPLNDIDYESNPAAVAQELSNLQALRRMSMDVGNTSDPDLPSFQGVSLMPTVAPTGGDDEDDPSRLFWVPARVHPELAPMEFKTFLENRVQTIKRRSGEYSSLSPDGPERTGSGGGLRRKKSMLSRQIDNSYGRGAVGYQDGAEQLERKKSSGGPELKISDLKELDELVRDPSKAMQKLTLDTSQRQDAGMEVPASEDMPILPAAPGVGLRRSTRTTYRRGSLRKGERVPFSKRAGARLNNETDGEDSPVSSPIGPTPGNSLTRVNSEPITENFSRPGRPGRRGTNVQQSISVPSSSHGMFDEDMNGKDSNFTSIRASSLDTTQPEQVQNSLPPRKSSFTRVDAPIPRIVETPPPPDNQPEEQAYQQNFQYPERISSQGPASVDYDPPRPDEPPPRSSKRPVLGRQASSTSQSIPRITVGQTLTEMAQQPSPLPGNSASTDTLTFIPTLSDERRPEKKLRKEEVEQSASKKSTWGWFKGGDEKEKKDKKKDEEVKKGKTRTAPDKAHDTARLDVLQHSIDTAVTRGRESLLLDRESIDHKLADERKKESSRKSGGEGKKEKDGIFSSLFGGSKKKDGAGKTKASSLRTLSPEPPYRNLRPDIDYNWTRFSILEERAIYRMAHIKLANPRRALYSQVLLSNFMYSYLAKVQQMHPHVQIPQSAQQKKQQEEERKRKEQEQQQLLEKQQQQRQQQQADHYRYDYHQVCKSPPM